MSNLERQPGQGHAGVLGTRSEPKNADIIGGAVGVEPESGRTHRVLGARKGHRPKPDMMALARAVADCLLEADVLATPEKIKGTERRRRIWRFECKCAGHAPRTCPSQSISS